jgi:predicted ArsR family transcriptional regulator
MQPQLNADERHFLDQIRQGAGTVDELCDRMGVTATAVRQRLARLEKSGCVERTATRHGRGRPFHTYRITTSGLRQLGDNYQELAEVLWEAVSFVQEPEVRGRLMNELKAAMVRRYGGAVNGDQISERVQQLSHALAGRGYQVELGASARTGLPILREHVCPYHDLASRDSDLCELEQAVFSEVLGTDVVLTSCCRNGDRCCEFEVQPELVS